MRGNRPSIAWSSMDVVHGRPRRRRKVWSVSQEECPLPGRVAGRFMTTCLQVCQSSGRGADNAWEDAEVWNRVVRRA